MSANAFTTYFADRVGRAGVRVDEQVVARIAKGLVIVISMVGALALATLTSKKNGDAIAAQTANAWSTRPILAQQITMDAFVAQWQVTQANTSDSRTLRWSTSDVAAASASLLALDAANENGKKIQRISINKRDGRIELSAEVAP
jgi:D-Tyr-tRNAtyr deacylase